MSYQHFRVLPLAPHPTGEAAFTGQIQPHGDPYQHDLQTISNSSPNKKGPYGSGDADDGYTLCFPSMAAFQEWKQTEEDEKMIEFVKGDSHQSRANPPRFKEHTKLVCARHSRSGRKKYVKKYPDRVRKVPSRKLEGQGCPASISYKTYHDSDQVRVCYASDHSHPIGIENLPFTRRGRKAQADQPRSRPSRLSSTQITAGQGIEESDQSQSPVSPMSSPTVDSMHSLQMQSPVDLHPHVPIHPHSHSPQSSQSSTSYSPHMQSQHHMVPAPAPAPTPMTITVPDSQPYVHNQPQPTLLPQSQPQPHPQQQFQPHPQASPQSIPQPIPQPASPTYVDTVPRQQQILTHAVDTLDNKWERMDAIFQHVRETARTFTFSPASVAMLESVLWRMYAETPPTVPATMTMMPMNSVNGVNGVPTTNINTAINGAPQPNGHP
ncbi:hypothetical protein QCA50_016304 [Cerrena zonata]|uniref:WRKY domain-containing protein n=1 Tax=Cerrena zonata TaxID=2478898 RepID=A0AAW0FSK8_9APHY